MAKVEVVAQSLVELDEAELTVQLGALSKYVEVNPEEAESTDFGTMPVARGAFDDLLKIGKSVFASNSSQAYALFCSPVEGVLIKDSELAQELTNLMEQKTSEAAAKATAIISPILTNNLALPQSLAVVIGALLVKKLAKGTSDLICTNWKKNIEMENT